MLHKLICALLVFAAGAAHALVPQTGTWVVTAELDGRPGRGFAIDVQNRTVVMQMYAYERNGEPTFYLGVGEFLPTGVVSMGLKRYSGGRYLGSPARSGVEAGAMGTAVLRFTSGITGYITLPGESEVAISRFNFAYPEIPSSLRGTWGFLTPNPATGAVLGEIDRLVVPRPASATGNGAVVTSDGRFGCEHQTVGVWAGTVVCVRFSATGAFVRGYLFKYSVNDGDGEQLDSGGRSTGQLFVVKRLATDGDRGTGILFSEPASDRAEPTPDYAVWDRGFAEVVARGQER